MVFTSKARDWSRSATSPAGGMREQLSRIDGAIDWQSFDKFLRWLRTESVGQFGHEPLVMFKALLLKQWFQLRAHDFELEVTDRLSFRNFIGLSADGSVPCHSDVSQFGHLLWERGIGEEVFSELTRQLTEKRFDDGANEIRIDGAHTQADVGSSVTDVGLEYFGAQVDFLQYGAETRPAEWRELEKLFSAYWNRRRRDDKYPLLSSIKLSETGLLRPHLALIRVADEGEDFIYEHVGARIEEKNGRALLGCSLRRKAAENLKSYGSYGLQGELFALFRSAIIRGRPVGGSAYFTNAAGSKCHLWSTVAPLVDDTDRVTMLLGAGMIESVMVN